MFSNILLPVIISVCTITYVTGQDFGYPEAAEADKRKQNSDNKLPVFIPGRCGENELLYPGDHKDDWVCDCKPGYLYYPLKNGCFNAYRQGPCNRFQILVLPSNKNIPECRPNRCRLDGQVRFQNKCYVIETAGPCQFPELSYVISVNATTLELECIRQNTDIQFTDRFGPDDDSESTDETVQNVLAENKCYKGGRRWIDGKCKD